jgi:hypothetical protein
MKDNELRAVVLQKYYDLRDRDYFQWCEVELDDQFPIKTFDDLGRICNQLGEHNLIDWRPIEDGSGKTVGGVGKITAFGVDVIEGTAKSPITITFDYSQTVSITGTNNIVGNHNSIKVEEINAAISHSNFSEVEKAEAKSLWQKVCENKLLNTVIGSVFGAATKHALETATQPK